MNSRLVPPDVLDGGGTHEEFLSLARQRGWRAAVQGLFRDSRMEVQFRRRFADDADACWQLLLPGWARGRMLLAYPGSIAEVLSAARWFQSTFVWTDCDIDRQLLEICAEQSNCPGLRVLMGPGELRAEARFNVIAVSSDYFERLVEDLGTPKCERGEVWYVSHTKPWGRSVRWLASNPMALRRSRKALVKVGLTHQRHFALLPECDQPDRIYLLKGAVAHSQGLRMGQTSVFETVKTRLQTVPVFCPSSGLVATASRTDGSWIESLSAHLAERLKLPKTGDSFPDVMISRAEGGGGLLLFLGDDAVVRVAFREAARRRVETNYRALERIREFRGVGLRCRTPEPLLLEEFDGVLVGAESRLEGRTADRYAPAEVAGIEDSLFRVLMELQQIEPGVCDPDVQWRQHAVVPFQRLSAWVVTDEQRRMVTEIAEFLAMAGGSALPLRRSHGDFKLANALVSESEPRIAVIDWDLYSDARFATIDFLHLVIHRRALKQRKARQLCMLDWLDGREADEVESRWTLEFAESQGLRDDWRMFAALTYWVREFANRVGTSYDLRTDWIQRNFLDLLPIVHRQVMHAP
jgi:aminoglycoside phosphotransferase (APT) family kinase protein